MFLGAVDTERPRRLLAPMALPLLFAALFAAGCGRENADPAARGKYLVTAMGCNDCHTPWKMGPKGAEPDMTRMLSGHPENLVLPEPPALDGGPWAWLGAATMTAFSGPWGITYAPNLTPHESGLGVCTEEMFVSAMRTGRHFGQGRPILPPMPYQNLASLADEDLRAVFAYLRSIPAIKNDVPDMVPPSAGPLGG